MRSNDVVTAKEFVDSYLSNWTNVKKLKAHDRHERGFRNATLAKFILPAGLIAKWDNDSEYDLLFSFNAHKYIDDQPDTLTGWCPFVYIRLRQLYYGRGKFPNPSDLAAFLWPISNELGPNDEYAGAPDFKYDNANQKTRLVGFCRSHMIVAVRSLAHYPVRCSLIYILYRPFSTSSAVGVKLAKTVTL